MSCGADLKSAFGSSRCWCFVTYHHLLGVAMSGRLNVLVHVRGVSHEATLGRQGHVLDHGLGGRRQQEPVHAVEATDRQTDR